MNVDRLYHTKKSFRDMRKEARALLRRFGGPRLLPAALIIGAQKAGTSSLFDYLVQVPEIAGPLEKEVHFFDLHYAAGLSWYRSHFPASGQDRQAGKITIEASPYYLFHPAVASRVRETLPDVQLIVMLRNPVERAYSHYWHEVKRGYESLSLEGALAAEESRLEGETQRLVEQANYRSFNHQHHSYLSRGLYAAQLERWFNEFARHRFHFVQSESFFHDPAGETRDVLHFLGIPATKEIHYRQVNTGSYTHMDKELRARLNAFYAPHNQRLFELIGQEFDW